MRICIWNEVTSEYSSLRQANSQYPTKRVHELEINLQKNSVVTIMILAMRQFPSGTGPPGRGFSAGLTTLPSKKNSVQDLININIPRTRGALDNKTRNRKNNLLFGTWNVRTIFKCGAAQNIIKEIEKYKLKIVALQKIRWDDTRALDIQETTILYGKCNEQRQIRTDFAVHKSLITNIREFKNINPRI
ncbi:hypothetical protein AGLY_016450 [Aphis glycines]|uniref:Endonuclease/exonuclease/phosphatase domain-containing protein n=1 Tax=Aphis glycines TaxID=307491 RepID=A0A6G0SXN4_APHGL|nr:hypothetical protein AGLY_016450 [Aphis glycines]